MLRTYDLLQLWVLGYRYCFLVEIIGIFGQVEGWNQQHKSTFCPGIKDIQV
jgi:hypothetical protein